MASPRPFVTEYHIYKGRKKVLYKITHSASFLGAMRAALTKIIRTDYDMAKISHPDEEYVAEITRLKNHEISVYYSI